MKRVAALALAGLVLLGLFSGGGVAQPPAAASAHPGVLVDNVSVSTTSSYSFQPNQITVTPGALVHLVVTQDANFAHSFVLSSVANFTIPSSDTDSQLAAFFNAHPPIVNLSIPGTVGAQVAKDFTAPALGTYEFVCIVSGHFQSGMFGFLYSGTSPPGGSSSSGLSLSPLVLGAIVGLVVVVVVVGVLIARRGSRRTPPQKPESH
jgi:plastocyanin